MEESSEGHSEGNKSALESNRKRIIKSRAQIEALEKFYEEHKYPVESLKAEFARSTGLTEKQVSGWLCHRRLKDKRLLLNEKKYANGKQDRSSGIVPDRGSGLKQDSCGSTKQGGGDRNFDAREVESKRTTSQKYASADDKYMFGGHFTREAGRADDSDDSDTTSGSSSSQPNVTLRVVDRDPLITASSRSQMGQRARSGPSGYLKVKGQVENAAVTAVKRQMGSNYRADGPPLAVAFDSLPMGAFDETPERETQTDNEEPSPPRPSNASISYKNHYHAMGIGHNSKTSSRKSGFDARRIQTESLSDDSDSEHNFQPRPKCKSPLLSNEDESFSRKSLVTDMHEGSMIDAPVYESRDRYPHEMGVKHGVGGRMKLDSRSGHHHSSPYNVRVNNVQPETEVYNYNGAHNKVVYKEVFENGIPNNFDLHYGQQKGASKRITKEVKLFGERIAAHDDFGSAQAKVLYKDEITAAKRVNVGPHQPHYRKTSLDDGPSWTTPANRFPSRSAEKSSSFSEDDESAETTSSYTN